MGCFRTLGGHRLLAGLVLTLLFCFDAPPAGAEASAAAPSFTPDPRSRPVSKRFVRVFPREHITHEAIGPYISSQAWTNYLSSLDFQHDYFLQQDIALFRSSEMALGDRLENGDVQFAYDVFTVLIERLKNRIAFTEALLAKGFDFKPEEDYVWKREHAPWPADVAEWDELWRKKIKNEYLRLVVARKLAETGKDKKKSGSASEADIAPEQAILKSHRQLLSVFQDTDAESLLQRYLSAFTHAYDPHSEYMSPSSMEDFDIDMKLSLVGIGALLRADDGAAKVIRVIPGGPADRDKRLREGDRIVAVGQGDEPPVNILHWPLGKIVRLIRGEAGTKAVLVVIPASDKSGATTKVIDIVRDEVKLEEQAAKMTLREVRGTNGVPRKMAVIALPTFYADMKAMTSDAFDGQSRSSANDVMRLIEQATSNRIDGMVLDLRNNGGGSLLEAVRITGLFISTGPTVQVRELGGVRRLYDRDPGIAYAGPVVVLINRLSASASEIVAAALQDYGRAVIVGDSKTHGKGSVQAIFPLGQDENLGSVKVTSSMFYRISGGSTQLRGVASDIVIPSPYEHMELGEDHLPNAMPWDSVARATYLPISDMGPILPGLRQKSGKRRAEDPRFVAYNRVLDRIRTLSAMSSLPLDMTRRLKLAEVEKEVEDLEEKLTAEVEHPPTDGAQSDLVLTESLRVLDDLAALKLGHDLPPDRGAVQRRNDWWPAVRSWLEDLGI